MVFGWLKRLIGKRRDDLFETHFHSLTRHVDEAGFIAAYDQMPPMWRHLVVTRWACNDIGNGGLPQFFYNSTGVAAPEAVQGFIAIGMPKAAEALKTAIGHFGPSYPRDWDTRIAIIHSFPETELIGSYPSAHKRFHELDEKFSDYIDTEGGGYEIAAKKYASPFKVGEI